MVGQKGGVRGDVGVVADGRKTVEVEVGREGGFEGVEDEVAGALEDFVLGELLFAQDALKLFYHLIIYLQLPTHLP